MKKKGIVMLKDADDFVNLLITNGYTPSSFAELVGCSKSQMYCIVKGERNPSPKIAKKICIALDKNFEDIFFVFNDDKSNQKTK